MMVKHLSRFKDDTYYDEYAFKYFVINLVGGKLTSEMITIWFGFIHESLFSFCLLKVVSRLNVIEFHCCWCLMMIQVCRLFLRDASLSKIISLVAIIVAAVIKVVRSLV